MPVSSLRVDIVDQNDPKKDKKTVPSKVNGVDVTLDILKFKTDTEAVQRRFPGTLFSVDPSTIETIPDGPCAGPGGAPCYPPGCGPVTDDEDCDGIRLEDNCPTLANPRQADANGNGLGQGCDPSELFLVCDVDMNFRIDRDDINAIFRARNSTAAPSDPLDPDADGFITVNDARMCVLRCANPGCMP